MGIAVLSSQRVQNADSATGQPTSSAMRTVSAAPVASANTTLAVISLTLWKNAR